MYYYKAISADTNEFIGVGNTFNLIYYNPIHYRFFKCNETKAQYIYINGEKYHIANSSEEESIKGAYANVFLLVISEEEYKEKIKNIKLD